MKTMVERKLENCSDRNDFRFRIGCEVCGIQMHSKPIPFSKAGLMPETRGKQIIYETLYQQEYEDARLYAVKTSARQLNCCPICKRVVCNSCFLICDDLDMCCDCAADLEEKGSPVLSDEMENLE